MFKKLVKILNAKDDRVYLRLSCVIAKNIRKFKDIVDSKHFSNKHTLLTFALANNLKKCALVLLKHGANPNVVGANNVHPFGFAVGDVDIMRCMVEKGLTVDDDNVGDFIAMNDGGLVAAIIRKGNQLSEPMYINGVVQTPLAYAIEKEGFDAIYALVENGVSINVADEFGVTAAHLVAQKCHMEEYDDFLDMLIALGANMDAMDDCKMTPNDLRKIAKSE
jgi:ankyrin repeat protein